MVVYMAMYFTECLYTRGYNNMIVPVLLPWQRGKELESLMSTGRKDLMWCSVEHLAVISFWLNMFFCPANTLWRRWEVLPRIEMSLDSLLCSVTPRTEPAFLINLFTMLVSTTFMHIHSMLLKDLSPHRKQNYLWNVCKAPCLWFDIVQVDS